MRRLLSKIGRKDPPEHWKIDWAKSDRVLYLPCYLSAQRRNKEITVVVERIQVELMGGRPTVIITGKDRGQQWGWRDRYDLRGNHIAKYGQYQGPYSVFPNFITSCVEGHVQQASGGNRSSKSVYDDALRERRYNNTLNPGDHRWLADLGGDWSKL